MENVSIERWKEAFAEAVRIAVYKDYFSDILHFDLFPIDYPDDVDDEEVEENDKAKWEYFYEAFHEVFGVEYR